MPPASRKRPASTPGFTTRGPSRERRYDMLLNSNGYVISGADSSNPAWNVETVAGELGNVPPQHGDTRSELATWHMGAGYGQLAVEGCYSYALNMDASQPGVIVMGPLVTRLTFGGTASCSGFFEINNTLYGLAGRYCKSINVTTDAIGTPNDGAAGRDFAASNIATVGIPYNGKVYVAFDDATSKKIESFDGTTWVTSADVAAKYWAKDYLDSYGWRLWKAHSSATVKVLSVGTDPITEANWVANAIAVGDTSGTITGMSGTDSVIWIAKTDGLYTLDWTTRAPNVFSSISNFTSTVNGKNIIVDGDRVYFPHIMGLLGYERTSGQIQSIQPFARTGNTSPIYGTVSAQARLGSWHYLAVWNGTDTYIVKGRHLAAGEGAPPHWVGPMIWHGAIAKLTGAQVNAMHITNLSSPARLYFGYSVGTTYDIGYITISKTGDPLAETGMTFAASGSIFLSPLTFTGGPVTAGTPKEIVGFDIENEGFSGSSYVAVYISLDGGSYTQFGTNATTAGVSRINIPSGTWRANRIYIRIDAVNASSSATIKIKPIVVRAALRPSLQSVIKTELLCLDDVTLRDKSLERRAGQTMVTELQGLTNSAPVTLTDYWTGRARSQTVVVEDVTETIIQQRGNDPAGYGVQVTMRVLTDSASANTVASPVTGDLQITGAFYPGTGTAVQATGFIQANSAGNLTFTTPQITLTNNIVLKPVNDRIMLVDFTNMTGAGGDAAIKVKTDRTTDSSNIWFSLGEATQDRSASWSFGKNGASAAEVSLVFSDVAAQGSGGADIIPSANARFTVSENGTIVRIRSGGIGIGGEPTASTLFDIQGTARIAGVLTMIGLITTAASATQGAGLRLPHGTAPTTPVDGDMWTTSTGLFVRINGVTKTVTLT